MLSSQLCESSPRLRFCNDRKGTPTFPSITLNQINKPHGNQKSRSTLHIARAVQVSRGCLRAFTSSRIFGSERITDRYRFFALFDVEVKR
jgi:hypothetical protein